MNVPGYLINSNINLHSSGSYSIGYMLNFENNVPENMNKKLFIKVVPMCNISSNEDYYFYYKGVENIQILVSHDSWYKNEVSIQGEIYDKTSDFPICLKIYNNFIVNNNNIEDFFKVVLKQNNISFYVDDVVKTQLQLGVIIMDFCKGEMAVRKFQHYYSTSKSFGSHFISNKMKTFINRQEKEIITLFYLTQILYALVKLMRMGYIHNDIHFGNIMINDSEICSNQAYDENDNIKYYFTGKVYIIDFGNAYNERLTNSYLKKLKVNEPREKLSFSRIINILGRKIIIDGYDFNKKQFVNKWYIYDWIINIFFNKKNIIIDEETIRNMETLVNNFEKNININGIKKTEKKCFCFW